MTVTYVTPSPKTGDKRQLTRRAGFCYSEGNIRENNEIQNSEVNYMMFR
jgi:hypothetical protein